MEPQSQTRNIGTDLPLSRELTLLCRIVHAECWNDREGELDTSCVRVAANAFSLLASRGQIEILAAAGRNINAYWISDDWRLSPGSTETISDPEVIDSILRMAEQFTGGPVWDVELDAFSKGLNEWLDAMDFLENKGFVQIIEKGEYVVSDQEAYFLTVQKKMPPGSQRRSFPMLKARIISESVF